jgi:hypothetical protein
MELPRHGLGTYVERDGRPAVRLLRTYPHPIDRVWAARWSSPATRTSTAQSGKS